MAQASPHPHKKTPHYNDNCQNCVRERKENESFIKIYQRLQEVEKKTFRVRQAVQDHKISNDTNRSFYKSLQQKIVSLPKVKKEINSQAIQSAGFQIAASILEKESKRKIVEENQRLKKLLSQMRTEKWEQSNPEQLMKSSYFTERRKPESSDCKMERTFNSCQTTIEKQLSTSETQNLQSELLTGQSCQNYRENTTQSSSFSFAPMERSIDLSKYTDLNLWLYQNQKNSKLQEELYLTSSQSKKKAVIDKRLEGVLPSIRAKK